jgi:preprotein translocase subunit SecG
MSPHCLVIFLQHSRSAGVIAASGTAHAMTGSAANNAAKTKTPVLYMTFNAISLAATES